MPPTRIVAAAAALALLALPSPARAAQSPAAPVPASGGDKPALGTAWKPGSVTAPATTTSTGGVPLPTGGQVKSLLKRPATPPAAGALPANYGLTSSLQSYLNAGGVDAVGAYQLLNQRYGQLPGAGETITNVSIGDLTDQSMADAGDDYVAGNGPTTVVRNGQRYLDEPSMPLIPTYVAKANGKLDPTGSTEGQDPSLGEILLDFGVMAPLPADRQRAENPGSGLTDLLGIAPGAKYRLVVPQEPTYTGIATALKAAAAQKPRPNVITASLGFGTDTEGFPGRYLEDDPTLQAVIKSIVHDLGIVVVVSSNDGTRLYTPAAVGPDGGSTPTDLATSPHDRTTIDDVSESTTPSRVLDSGAIAAGGTTLDDTLATAHDAVGGTVAETRISGAGDFSSGFGTRVDLSAPSDNIVVFEHTIGGGASDVEPVLNGGTSASAPEIAAAAAVVLQTARLTGHKINPAGVRTLLQKTGREVATPAQIDRKLQVGRQVDVTAAVGSLLPAQKAPALVRVSVAHRITLGEAGGQFTEYTDPGRIDLESDGTGEGLVGPVTFGLDVTGGPTGKLDYVLRVGGKEFHNDTPSIRVLPADLLAAAGLPLVADADRTVAYTLLVRRNGKTLLSTDRTIVVGPTDGTYAEAVPPTAPASVASGQDVTVHYDLTGVRNLDVPQIAVSEVGHWNPQLAPIFNRAWTADLTGTSGDVTIPASAFTGGAGLYGIGIIQVSSEDYNTYGEFTPIRVGTAPVSSRPAAPTFAGGAHTVSVTRSAPKFTLNYSVPGGKKATLEISAPGPTVYGAVNTYTNANGSGRDADGITTGSVVYQQLPASHGTVVLDALKLGVATSTTYNVRVIGSGQASPSSLLAVDDALAPGDDVIDSFGIAGASSVAAVHDDAGSSLVHYDATTEKWGTAFAADPDPDSRYEVVGTDAAAQRVVALHFVTGSAADAVVTYDLTTGKLVGRTAVGTAYTVLGGRVDASRHRAALLARQTADNADVVLPIDVRTGVAGVPIATGQTKRYQAIDLDAATGTVYLAHLGAGPGCITSAVANVAAVDLGTGTVTPSGNLSNCAAGFASDGHGGNEYQAIYRSFSVNIVGSLFLQPIDAKSLVNGATVVPVRQQFPLGVTVDGANGVALVPFTTPAPKPVFGYPNGILSDSNATAEIQLASLADGTSTLLKGFAYTAAMNGNYDRETDRGVQIDPATRTGWTFGPGGRQIRRFSY